MDQNQPKGWLKKSSNSGKIFTRYLLLSTLGPRVRQCDETKVLQYHKSSKANSLLGSLRTLVFPTQFVSIYVGLSPLPVRVTTRIITLLVGNPYKPSFPLLLGGGTTQNICNRQIGSLPQGYQQFVPLCQRLLLFLQQSWVFFCGNWPFKLGD